MLQQVDVSIFYLFNHLPHPLWLDFLARIIYYLTLSAAVYFFIALVLLGVKNKRWLVGPLVISLLLTLGISDLVLKPIINRSRPFNVLTNVKVVPPVPKTASFPSAQTASAFAAATIAIFTRRKKVWITAMAWAVLAGLSRMYMGHHYFSDVLAGAMLGSFISWAVWELWKKTKWSKYSQILNKSDN
jgi:undecaprenyl-diphosphatase